MRSERAVLAARVAAVTAELERRERAAASELWIPHNPTPKQQQFLELVCFEAMFGGALGGGKSDALLAAALQHVDVPGYSAILFRRVFPSLEMDGGLIPRSHDWLGGTKAHWRGDKHQWTFPSGATLSFGHIQYQKDMRKYQGGAWQFMGWDELTEFPRSMYMFLRTRCRKTKALNVPLRVRSATNPGNIGHDWVKERFVDPGDPARPFIPSLLEDNPHLEQEQYAEILEELDETTYAQLRKGVWIRDTGGLIYPITEENLIEELPDYDPKGWRWVLGIDPGTSATKETLAMCVTGYHREHPLEEYVAQSEAHKGWDDLDMAQRAKELNEQYDGFTHVVIDEGGLGKTWTNTAQRHGLPAEAADKLGKLKHRRQLRHHINRGRLRIVRDTNEGLIDECHELCFNEDGTDNEKGASNHRTDTLLYSWYKTQSFTSKLAANEPAPGSREAIERWQQQELERERREVREQKQRRFYQKRRR